MILVSALAFSREPVRARKAMVVAQEPLATAVVALPAPPERPV